MSRVERLKTVFVDEIPEILEDGVLYVSRACKVALHNCACGCGEEVSTPLVATEYNLTMEGNDASVWPSVGNHDFARASHYVIQQGRIVWAGQMSRGAIEKGLQRDRELKRPNVSAAPVRPPSITIWSLRRIWNWLKTMCSTIFG
ncbi:DUF6527 family protein [Sphingomonas kyeonggiensis]|uniref:DUF6527 family protein n=1 Tax=Sphingomonas kyeonggiensis TaxID=1268553 RepID=UPI001C87AF66